MALWFLINNGKSSINDAFRDFAVSDTAAIDKIVLTDKTHAVTIERFANGNNWKVNHTHDANMRALRTLLYTINKIDIKAPISKNEAQGVVKKLIESAIRCDIYQHGELKKSYYIGGPTPDNIGTYMVLVDVETNEPSEKPFITYVPAYNSYVSYHYTTDIGEWIDKTVFNYNEIDMKSIKVENPVNPEKSYELLVNQAGYQIKMLSDNKLINNIDTVAVNQYLTYYFKLNYESVDTTHTNLSKEQPVSIITVTDKKDIVNKVFFFTCKSSTENGDKKAGTFHIDPAHLFARLNNGDIVTVQLYLFGKLFQNADYFVKQ